MSHPEFDEKELLKTILEPLLEDFTYWFSRSQQKLKQQQLSCISLQQQQDLLARIEQALKEVDCAKLLFNATDQKAGVTMEVVAGWHQLVTECWLVAQRDRQAKDNQDS
ncbi:MAG: DUF2605 domain-containing protein [Synechocystis sp.]|nr:DUF2605 domain-containing protein [Synechocystis sp.]